MDDKASSTSNGIDYDVIPPTHAARTLVLCFDGTGDSFDADNSNVIQFFSTLVKGDRSQQMVYYQAGIGTYTSPQIATPVMATISKTLDMMVAWNLDAHVMDGYEFLMQNYTIGDKICIFGFSRGAYTARALAGMIHKVGLLPAYNRQQVPFAYKMFSRTDETGWKQSTGFKKAFSMDVDIEFIGVWDTVNSVGLIPHHLPFTTSNSAIKTFRHAVSLDEHRAKFKANLYNLPTKKESDLGTKTGEMPKATSAVGTASDAPNGKNGKGKQKQAKTVASRDGRKTFRMFEAEFDEEDVEVKHETDVLEVWFSGCHCDVGGGSVDNSSRHNLARIPLRWMIRQCFLANTGIRFHAPLLAAIGLDPTSLYPVVKPRPPAIFYAPPPSVVTEPPESPTSTTRLHDTTKTLVNFADVTTNGTSNPPLTLGYGNVPLHTVMSEEEEDLADALCPIYDQLQIARYWWVLEVLPMTLKTQKDDDNEWVRNLTINFGRPRVIPKQKQRGINVHRSVKIRMDAGNHVSGGKYAPRAQWHVEPRWMD